MDNIKLGFLGLGAIGFPMCYGLYTSGYKLNLPTYRREEDQARGFSPIANDAAEKTARIDEMLSGGCTACASQKELVENSDVILISMPKSQHVELLMEGEDGIIANIKKGGLVIDLTSADPASTRRLSKRLEEAGADMLDACVSGGVGGAAKQTLTIMVGGKKEVFDRALPILNTIGDPKKVSYIGPSGAGDTIKCANNFLSAMVLTGSLEALAVCMKAGIDPKVACEVIGTSGGSNDAVTRKLPDRIFKGTIHNFAMQLMVKDVNLFNTAARDFGTPSFFGNLTYEIYNAVMQKTDPNADMIEVTKAMEELTGLKIFDIDHD